MLQPTHRPHRLIPAQRSLRHNLRSGRQYSVPSPRVRTDSFKRSVVTSFNVLIQLFSCKSNKQTYKNYQDFKLQNVDSRWPQALCFRLEYDLSAADRYVFPSSKQRRYLASHSEKWRGPYTHNLDTESSSRRKLTCTIDSSRRSAAESGRLSFPSSATAPSMEKVGVTGLTRRVKQIFNRFVWHTWRPSRAERGVSFSAESLPFSSLSRMNNIRALTSVWSKFLQVVQAKEGTFFGMQTAGGGRGALATPRQTKGFQLWCYPFPVQLTLTFKARAYEITHFFNGI